MLDNEDGLRSYVIHRLAKDIGVQMNNYPQPEGEDWLDDPNWVQEVVPKSLDELGDEPLMYQFIALDGYSSSSVPRIDEIVDLILHYVEKYKGCDPGLNDYSKGTPESHKRYFEG